ncbi:MAG: hypothetical protein NTV39_00005 [Candidatus Saccharibacteria bacterium]|nr:hypothetical protein [Candidatus Saccharibacteria bacterium]
MGDTVKGRFRKPVWRILRMYSGYANQSHDCTACKGIIHPGEKYTAEVRVLQGRDYPELHRFEVWKYHDECPEDPDKEDWMRDSDEEYERYLAEKDNDTEAEAEEPMTA